MNAAVLCPGPSLERFPGRDAYELVIAVNRAVTVCECDYVILLDAWTFSKCGPIPGKPTIVAAADIYHQMCGIAPAALHHPFLERDVGWLPKTGVLWQTKGLTTALVLAWVKGATEVECVGVDWSGAADWDGFTHPRQQRTADRWTRERQLARATVALIEDRGAAVSGLPLNAPTGRNRQGHSRRSCAS